MLGLFKAKDHFKLAASEPTGKHRGANTHPKINMEPENTPFGKGKSSEPNHHFQVLY